MHRRGFLGTALSGAALGSGVIAGSALGAGCGGLALPRELAESEARALCARLLRGTQMLANEPFGVLPASRFARPDLVEHVLRLSIESLLVLDVMRSVPEDTAMPTRVADAIAPHLPRLDRSAHTHRALLARMPAHKRRALDDRARREPDLGMNVAAWIDEHAGRLGVPHDNRLRLRHSAMTVKTRLRRQSTRAVIDDCTQRLDELLARRGEPLPAELATHTDAVVDAMWRDPVARSVGSAKTEQRETEEDLRELAADRTAFVVPSRFGADREMRDPTEPVQWNASWARPGDEENRLATVMLSLGLVSCGLLLIAGLFVFMSGEIQNGEWDGRTHADDWTGD